MATSQDNFDIYVKLIDRVEYHPLTTDPARDMSPAWSPDGRTIAFAREGAVFLIAPTRRQSSASWPMFGQRH